MRKILITTMSLLFAVTASAQLGDLLKRIKPDQIKKGANVVRESTREFTEDEEADIGRVVAARVLKTYPLAKNDKLQQYITLVGNTVAAYSARPTLEWHFAVIDTPIVNAFSCPGGFIFITTGALSHIHSEAELAAVIGHELAHVTQKHILKEVKRGNVMSAATDLAKSTTSTGSFLTDQLGEKIANLATEKLFKSGLSRRDEEEADKIGIELTSAAGYRAGEFVNFLKELEQIEHGSEMSMLTATHPGPADRIKYLQPVIKEPQQGEVLAERWASWTKPSAK